MAVEGFSWREREVKGEPRDCLQKENSGEDEWASTEAIEQITPQQSKERNCSYMIERRNRLSVSSLYLRQSKQVKV